MSLTGTTVYMVDYARPLSERLAARKVCGPYQWLVPAPGPSRGCGYYAADEIGNPGDSMFQLRACDVPSSIDHAGWFTDEYGDGDKIMPVVFRLPHGRGFLAGWTMGAGMASSVEFDIYDDENEAWRAADSLACDVAEDEREHNRELEAEE